MEDLAVSKTVTTITTIKDGPWVQQERVTQVYRDGVLMSTRIKRSVSVTNTHRRQTRSKRPPVSEVVEFD